MKKRMQRLFMGLFCLLQILWSADMLYAQVISEVLKSPADTPFVSQSVLPRISKSASSLQVITPSDPGSPMREINPRRGWELGKEKQVEQKTIEDPLLKNSRSRSSLTETPEPFISFEGINARTSECGCTPPDTVGDVGPNHYVQMVNTAFTIYDKKGNRLAGPSPINKLWEGKDCQCAETNDGDPIVLYDPLADRWLLSQFSLYPGTHMCVAISKTPDPTGEYYLYDFEVPVFPDYPKFGVWTDGYYMSTNEGPGYVGAYAFDRAKMLAGQPATFQYFSVQTNFMLPSDIDGHNPPPSGSPNYFYTVMDDTYWSELGFHGEDRLEVWEFRTDFEYPENSSFSQAYSLPTAEFNYYPPFGGYIIPQKGTEQNLDPIAGWPMWRLQYRNFGDYETLVGNFTVDVGESDFIQNHIGIRWFELRKTGEEPWTLYQEGTHSPDGHYRWMGSIAMDGAGNIALGYSASSKTLYPSIRYAVRLAGDDPGTMGNEATLINGTGSQFGSWWWEMGRWGDYSSMNVDPADDCTFWYTNEYYKNSSDSGFWQTRIGAFKIPECKTPSRSILQGVVKDAASGNPLQGARINIGAFTAVTDSTGNYRFSYLPPQIYDVTVLLHGYEYAYAAGVSVSEGKTVVQNFAINPLPMVTVTGKVSDGSGAGWPLYAKIDIISSDFGDVVYTNPITGLYSVKLAQDKEYSFSISAVGGYNTETFTVKTSVNSSVNNFKLTVDPAFSEYYNKVVLYENFNSCELPEGWKVFRYGARKAVWEIYKSDPADLENYTGGTECYAIADSDLAGTVDMDTELRTPSIDCSNLTTVTLEFNYDFQSRCGYDYYYPTVCDVEISTDGGYWWDNVFQLTAESSWWWGQCGSPGPQAAYIDISWYAAGYSDVMIRFHYYMANYDLWWQIDDVKVSGTGQPSGGLVIGNLYDKTAQQFVNGAEITDGKGHTVTTFATPDDPNIDDGFYILYLPSGSHTLTANAVPYEPVDKSVTSQNLKIVRQNFEVGAKELPDYSLYYDGINDYTEIPGSESLNLTDALTIEAWINPSGMSWLGSIVDKGKFSVSLNENNGSLIFGIFNNDDSFISLETPVYSVAFDIWQHVAVTYDGIGEAKIYINGVRQMLTQSDGFPSGTIPNSSRDSLVIGNSANHNRAFSGMIDEVRVWNTARTEEEIINMKDTGLTGDEKGLAAYWSMSVSGRNAADASVNENNGTVYGAKWVEGVPLSGQPDGLQNVILILKVLAGMNPDGIESVTDVNADGKIGMEEAVHILQVAAELH